MVKKTKHNIQQKSAMVVSMKTRFLTMKLVGSGVRLGFEVFESLK